MTGRIKSLSGQGEGGFIAGEDGLNFPFDSSAVLAYDAGGLAVGQTVTFDLKVGLHPEAVHVCVQKSHHPSTSAEKHRVSINLRYASFVQEGNVRAYRFEQLSAGEATRTFLITANLDLFRKHSVGIQEGPTLCMRVLMADLISGVASHRTLTDLDMLAHVASRPSHAPKGRHRSTSSRPPQPHAS